MTLLWHCPQVCVSTWVDWPINLHAQNNLGIHHLAQTHEHMPMIELPAPPPQKKPLGIGLLKCLDIWSMFALGANTLIKCVHSTYLRTMLYIHSPLSTCHLELARMLGSRATCKLMGCGLPLHAFGHLLPSVPPNVNPKVHTGAPPYHDSLPRGGYEGVFSSSTIVAKTKIFFCPI